MNLHLAFQPKQAIFDKWLDHSSATWLGYGGSRGGAKSGGLRRSMLRRRVENPGTAGQIVRRTFDDVKTNHIDKFFAEFPDLYANYSVQERRVTIPTIKPGVFSTIQFSYMETHGDVERKSRGPEYMDIFVDQAEQFTEKELTQIQETCRWPNTPLTACKYGLFFNPGGAGSAFLRRIFHTHEYHENENPADFAFLQAYVWDNVEWSRAALREDGIEKNIGDGSPNDFYTWDDERRFNYTITRSAYGRKLNALPEAQRMGELLGEFVKFAGQYFTNFDPARHVKTYNRANWLRRWISIDYGYEHPSDVQWHCAMGDMVHTYRELNARELTPKALGHRIADLSIGEAISAIVGSPDLQTKGDRPESLLEQLNKALRERGMPYCSPADNDRVSGWMVMLQMLQADPPGWTIDPSCLKLLDSLPMMVRDPDKVEDCLKVDGDDAPDCARYGIKWHLAANKKPPEIQDREAAKTITDPYAKHFFMAKRQQGRANGGAIFVPETVMPGER